VAKLLLHPEAQAEYQDAIDWYRLPSSQAADQFESEVERVLTVINQSPQMFPKYDDMHRYAVVR
jgi:plasmid stabilization system protein ParE